MIARPVKLDCAGDAWFIVAADGAIVADCITREEWAREIVELINGKADK